MPYVYRDLQGKVSGTSSHPPTDAAEEFLPDNHPEVIAYLRPPPKSAADVSVKELITQMIKDGAMTQAKIDAIKAAR